MSIDEQPFRWRSIALPVLLPALLFGIGEGAVLPIIPIVAADLAGSLVIAGIVAALLTIGELLGNIPSGWLIGRVGERPAMIGAAGLGIVGLVVCVIAPNPVALGFGVFLLGLAAAMFALARQAFLASFVPLPYRARALSTLGGTLRFGIFVGPFLSAGLIHLTGVPASAFWINVVACVGVAIVLLVLPDPEQTFGAVRRIRMGHREVPEGEAEVELESVGLFRTIAANRGVLARMGLGAAVLSAVRTSRQVLLPLWAVSIGVSDTTTALVIGIAAGLDFALFYTSGWIMDRFGRLWSAVPALVGLAAGHFVLAFTHDVPDNFVWFVAAAMVLSLANGVGSGIVMTLGADLADRRNPAPFLGAFRFTGNLGGALSPLIIAGLTAIASLAVAAGSMGVLALVGAAVLGRYIPRYVPRSEPPRST